MRQQLVGWLGAVMLSLSAVHAEEPAPSPVTPEEMQRELAAFASPLEYAKSLKAEAEQGDGRAKQISARPAGHLRRRMRQATSRNVLSDIVKGLSVARALRDVLPAK